MSEKRITMADLASGLSRRASLPVRYAEEFVASFFALIDEGLLHDNIVKVKGFGTFKLIEVEPRKSVNVNTGEHFEIAGHTKVSFTPDPVLRDTVNKPFIEFETVILNEGTDTALMEATDDDIVAEVAETEEKDVEAVEKNVQPLMEQPAEEEEPTDEAQPAVSVEQPAEEAQQQPAAVSVAESADEAQPAGDEAQPTDDTQPAGDSEPEATYEEQPKEVVQKPAETETQEDPVEDEVVLEPSGHTKEHANKFANMDKKNNHNALWIVLTALLFTIIGYCLGYYWHPVALPELCKEQPSASSVEQPSTPSGEQTQPSATVPSSSDEAIPASAASATAPAAKPDLSAAADYPQIEGGEYAIVGVLANDTMKVGKMLTKMAIQYYGDKNLYVYICAMNDIKNPDVVPLNKPLLIPKLEKK